MALFCSFQTNDRHSEQSSLVVMASPPASSMPPRESITAKEKEIMIADNDGSCVSTKDDGTCIWTDENADENETTRHYYNEALHADNIIDVDVPIDVVAEIFKAYETDIAPYYDTNQSTDDFCLVVPYAPGVKTWGSFVNKDDIRSDIRWYSVNNPQTYERYLPFVERLGLMDRLRELDWISPSSPSSSSSSTTSDDDDNVVESDDDLTVISMFFIPRSFSKKYQFHEDWSEEIGTEVVTFLIPLSLNFTIGLAYKDNDDEIRTYDYTLGKAVGVGGGMLHSTGIGRSETQDVLLCVYIGGKDPEMWEYTQDNIADELEHYRHPFKGFIRNEFLTGRPSKCQ